MRTRLLLMVESNDGLVDIVRQEMATTAYALLYAKNGQEALDYLDLLKSEIDIVIINMDLSVVNGLHVIWRLVKQKQPKLPRIIARSSMDEGFLLKHVVKKFGADAVVHVAVAVEDLRETIKMVLDGCFKGDKASAVTGM